jgi:predicted nuclease of predicted toxin-antitoxin system
VNILADESVEASIISRLRQDGHTIIAVAAEAPGITDLAVLEWAVAGAFLLLTADRDFGDIILRDAHAAPRAGVVLYRLRRLTLAEKAERVSTVFATSGAEFADAFVVIERDRIRRRSLK